VFLLGTWQSDRRGALTRGWQVSWLAAFRTGFPFTVFGLEPDYIYGRALIENQRADLVNPDAVYLSNPSSVRGGQLLLNEKAFATPAAGVVGNSGRNAFRGPGLYNVDMSLARSFSVPNIWRFKVPEGTRLTFRADAFNVLNHANLNNPNNVVGGTDEAGKPNFGIASYGRQGTASGFPATSPVNETARQFQLMVRLEF